jgi:hypothetical protein
MPRWAHGKMPGSVKQRYFEQGWKPNVFFQVAGGT